MDITRLVADIPSNEATSLLGGYLSARELSERSVLTLESRVPRISLDALGSTAPAHRLRRLVHEVEEWNKNLSFNEAEVEQIARDLAELSVPLTWLHDELSARASDEQVALSLIFRLLGPWFSRLRFTDLTNAQRFCRCFGEDVSYSPGMGWLVWDGRRWQRDGLGHVANRAKGLASTWHGDAELVIRTASFAENDDERLWIYGVAEELIKGAKGLESGRTVAAMLKVVETEPGIAVPESSFDANPWLLNVMNGTLDLRTGDLRPHERADRITRLAPVTYRTGARFSLWDHFLEQLTGGDGALRRYLQRACGYAITGLTDEEVLFFVFGRGGSGKSTLVKAIMKALGDYAATADFESFVKHPGAGGIRNDIARLRGCRVVSSIEVDEGKELAEGLVKTLTGGDVVAARFLYKEFFEFEPTFTLFLVANNPPSLDADDSGTWRRIRVMPLDKVVPEGDRDPMMKTLLASPELAGPAILKWLVEGCRMWQAEGLGSAPAIEQATSGYREEMDVLGRFIDDVCLLDASASVPAGDLYRAYSAWAFANGEAVLSNNLFGRKLTGRGFALGRFRGQWVRHGLRVSIWRRVLLSDDDDRPTLPPGGEAGRVSERSQMRPRMRP